MNSLTEGSTNSGTGIDPAELAKILPLEAARASILHWWREPFAGIVSVGVGVWDTWHYGRDAGLSTSIDELLVIGGVVLIAGSRKLFTGQNGTEGVKDE